MTLNAIELECQCGNKQADVQAKFVQNNTMVIQVKCTKCFKNTYLKEDDKRCTKFFKDSPLN